MNSKNIIIIILILFLGISIYFNLQNSQENAPVTSTEKQQLLFEMKQKCRIVGENKKKEYEDNNIFFKEESYTFSEELNTCLFYAYSFDYFDDNWVREKFVTDLSTDQDIIYFYKNHLGEQNTQIFCKHGGICVSEEDFDNRKRELFKE